MPQLDSIPLGVELPLQPEPEFAITRAFSLDEGYGAKLNVSVTFSTETRKPLSVSFSDPDRDQLVSVPADLWERVVAAVQRNWEY